MSGRQLIPYITYEYIKSDYSKVRPCKDFHLNNLATFQINSEVKILINKITKLEEENSRPYIRMLNINIMFVHVVKTAQSAL